MSPNFGVQADDRAEHRHVDQNAPLFCAAAPLGNLMDLLTVAAIGAICRVTV